MFSFKPGTHVPSEDEKSLLHERRLIELLEYGNHFGPAGLPVGQELVVHLRAIVQQAADGTHWYQHFVRDGFVFAICTKAGQVLNVEVSEQGGYSDENPPTNAMQTHSLTGKINH